MACQGVALLALEGLSTGLFLALLPLRGHLASYVTGNELPTTARAGLLLCMIATALVFGGTGAVYLWRHRGEGSAALRRWALRLSPLLLVGLVPPLLYRWLWSGRDLTLLAVVTVLALGGQALLRTAFSQPTTVTPSWLAPPRTAWRRWRRRMPRVARALPGSLVGLGAAGYAAFFSYWTLVNHWNLRTRSFDLGIENNLLWNLVHGGPLFKSSPIFGPTGSHLSHHATFFAYVMAPVYALAPRPETLLIIQAVLMGAAAGPLFLFARRHVGAPAASAIALAYLLYPPLHGANLYDFHYLSVGPFFLWTTLYLLEARRDWLAAGAIALTLSVREDVAAGLALLGLYLVFSGERPRAGLLVALLAGSYFVGMKFLIMPIAGPPSPFLFMFQGLAPPGERTVAGVLKTIVGNPVYTISTVLERDKLVYVLQILAPLAFLPLRRPLGLLFLLPGLFFTLLSTGYPPLIQISFQYTSYWTAFAFPAATLGLAWVARGAGAGEGRAVASYRAWLVAMLTASLVCSYQFGAILHGNVRGGFTPFRFETTAADRERYEALSDLIALVAPRAKVVASETLVPHVSSRPDAYTLRVGSFDAEYLLFPIERRELMWPAEGGAVVGLLESGEFGVVEIRHPFALARRGHSTQVNGAILERLARR